VTTTQWALKEAAYWRTGSRALKRAASMVPITTFVVVMSACDVKIGSDPNKPATYSCGGPAAGHCYATVSFGGGCTSANPPTCLNGYRVFIQAQSRMRPGDLFITNEMWVNTFNGIGWIELGYTSEFHDSEALSGTGARYFWAQNRDGLFTNTDLEPVPAEDVGKLAMFEVRYEGSDVFHLRIVADKGRGRTILDTRTTNGMWHQEGYGWVTIGSELAGTGGAYADLTVFQYMTRIVNGVPAPETQDDPPLDPQPPYISWLVHPNTENSEGGAFATHCCVLPD
jgi:hypothetical protein